MSFQMSTTEVLDCEKLKAFSTIPLFVQIIDYNPPVNNIWANEKYLQAQGLVLDDFCKLVLPMLLISSVMIQLAISVQFFFLSSPRFN